LQAVHHGHEHLDSNRRHRCLRQLAGKLFAICYQLSETDSCMVVHCKHASSTRYRVYVKTKQYMVSYVVRYGIMDGPTSVKVRARSYVITSTNHDGCFAVFHVAERRRRVTTRNSSGLIHSQKSMDYLLLSSEVL
jgi:hypothetical protein